MTPDAIEARFLWARRQGHPFWLWPDVSVRDWRLALGTLERVTAALLAGRSAPPIETANNMQHSAFRVALHTAGVGPWLASHIEQGQLQADAGVETLLLEHLGQSRIRTNRMAATTRQVAAILRPHAHTVVGLKGIHTAHAVFKEPALRPMADIDLLPLTDDLAACERALAAHGYVTRGAGRNARPYRSEWLPPGHAGPLRSLTITHADDPFSVDLHGTLDIDFFGVQTVSFGALSAKVLTATPEHGSGVSGLRQPLLAAHLAVHASHGLHSLTLIRLIELALVLRRDVRSKDDWNELSDFLHAHEAERFAFPAMALVDKLASDTIPHDVLRRLERASSSRQRRILGALAPADAQRLDKLALDERFMWATTPLEFARRLGNMLLPTGLTGPVRRLLRIYVERAFRIARLRVSLRGDRT